MSQTNCQNGVKVFTVDVEEYFHVEAFSPYIKKKDWGKYPYRIEETLEQILKLLSRYGVRGTFFILGWLAEKKPSLVSRIHAQGHEIASHGYDHSMITNMAPESFRLDVRRAKTILEDITNAPVHGYRAPTFSIVEKTSWAHPVLLEEGYRYSSSVYPILHDRYGWPGFGLRPRVVAHNGTEDLMEVPLSVFPLGFLNVPFAGGGYLRAYPFFLTKLMMDVQTWRGYSPIVYIHPWELDESHPGVRAPYFRRARHYFNISTLPKKIEKILQMKEFVTMNQFVSMEKEMKINDSRKLTV
jgi:polysaccharide deacetylase family protein (PEP-CTERM system associated)